MRSPGLWERWKDRKAGTDLLSFTVIVTDANEVVEKMHDRMPVIIPEKDYDRRFTTCNCESIEDSSHLNSGGSLAASRSYSQDRSAYLPECTFWLAIAIA